MSYTSSIEFKIKRSAQLMTYPKTGITKKGAPAGRVSMSLIDGKVNFSDFTDDDFDKSLTKMGDRRARSCFIFVNDSDAIVTVGSGILPAGLRIIYVVSATGFD